MKPTGSKPVEQTHQITEPELGIEGTDAGSLEEVISMQQVKIDELKQCLIDLAEIPIEAGVDGSHVEYVLSREGRSKTLTTGMIRKARLFCGMLWN
jgi:hypothetical protein